MRLPVRALAASVVVCVLVSDAMASAASIGINFASGQGLITNDLAPTDSTGAVAQQHWNNFNAIGPYPTFLSDSQGNVTTIPWPFVSGPADSGPAPAGTPTGNLLHEGLGGNGIVNLGLIPYARYDVYIYFGPVLSGLPASAQINGQVFSNFQVDVSGSTSFTNATSSTPGNYIRLAGATQAFTAVELLGSTAYLAGIQIVAVPEPGSLALAAIGLLGLVAYRFRRRAVI